MFIESQDRIIDTNKIRKEQILLKKFIEHEISEILAKYGFEKKEKIYINKELFLTCRVTTRANYTKHL